ncbi:hypothetical protein ACRAWD_14680 [Caulobacter segnis]
MGLNNVRQRLKVLFGERGVLQATPRERGFLVLTRMPLRFAPGRGEGGVMVLKVLLVDDEPAALERLSAPVRPDPRHHCGGRGPATAAEAGQAIAELAPDLVMLDIQMPELQRSGPGVRTGSGATRRDPAGDRLRHRLRGLRRRRLRGGGRRPAEAGALRPLAPGGRAGPSAPHAAEGL